jgi:hypothetical protein
MRPPILSDLTATAARRGAHLAAIPLLALLAGCSLISLKSPEKPLSPRDLNARILTREYSAHFIGAVSQAADQIAAATDDQTTRLDSLRWKIAAAAKSQRAASQMAPMLSLLDTWALSLQMSDFLATGNGKALFGAQQAVAANVAQQQVREVEQLAGRVTTPDEYLKDKQFIELFAETHPIENLHFARDSIVEAWAQASGTGTKLVDTLGTVPEALADAGDRLRMYGSTGPELVVWQAQLAARESGFSDTDLKATLQHFDDRINQLSTLMTSAPQLVGGVMREAGTRFDYSWDQVMRDVRAEQGALSTTVSTEREAAVTALDAERTALAADASRIADQVIRDTGDQVRKLVREALMLIIALTVVVLGVPFVAGYLVGRARSKP